jgi:hypothetical protein
MEDPKALRLFREVLAKSKQGRILWEPTAKENEYISVLPSGNTISISCWETENSFGDTGRAGALTLINLGQELLRVTSDVEGVEFDDIQALYEAARRYALHVDDKLDVALGDLARM